MIEAVEKNGWDGEWFLRAYDAFGHKVGSDENKEGKIFIEPQGMCVMAGIGVDNGMAQKAMDASKKYLEFEYGDVLLWPAYTEYHLELGEISSYPPGYKENGSVFCHNNPWIMIAQTVLGHGDAAFELYKKIAPAYIEDQQLHRTEPYVYAQTVNGKESYLPGEAKNSWLTGTSAWNFFAISQAILGVKPQFDGHDDRPLSARLSAGGHHPPGVPGQRTTTSTSSTIPAAKRRPFTSPSTASPSKARSFPSPTLPALTSASKSKAEAGAGPCTPGLRAMGAQGR